MLDCMRVAVVQMTSRDDLAANLKSAREFVAVDEIVRSPSGKADYRWAKAAALAKLLAPRS